MGHLAKMKELDTNSYVALKNLIVNEGRIYGSYYIVTGNYGGNEVFRQYANALEIAFDMDDRDLYRAVCDCVGARVATKSSSPAIYMIFREQGGRYVFYASDNLGVRKAV